MSAKIIDGKEAARILRQEIKIKVDALAANIILQTYLDKERGGKI